MSLIAEILSFPLFLIELAWGAIRFSTDAFLRAAYSGEAQTAALFIAFLAGVSEMLGQSVILVVNRVALYRFLASLAFTGLTYVITAVAWGLCAIAVAPLTRVGVLGPGEIAGVVGVVSLAFAPRLFGVFSIAPYFGLALGRVLDAWAMTLAIFGLHVGLSLPLAAAVFCGIIGWAVSYGVRAWLGHALAAPLGKLRHAIIGSPLDRSPQQIIDDLAQLITGESRK